eukprot:11107706-Alexandrium_andersonii.AAC.1
MRGLSRPTGPSRASHLPRGAPPHHPADAPPHQADPAAPEGQELRDTSASGALTGPLACQSPSPLALEQRK